MKQNSTINGTSTSIRVTAIVENGILIEVHGHEYFLPYNSNPWFENARVSDVFNVEPVGHLGIRWSLLDVDLSIDSLKYPEKYPLISKF